MDEPLRECARRLWKQRTHYSTSPDGRQCVLENCLFLPDKPTGHAVLDKEREVELVMDWSLLSDSNINKKECEKLEKCQSKAKAIPIIKTQNAADINSRHQRIATQNESDLILSGVLGWALFWVDNFQGLTRRYIFDLLLL